MTVTGQSVADNLREAPDLKAGQDVILPVEAPITATGERAGEGGEGGRERVGRAGAKKGRQKRGAARR